MNEIIWEFLEIQLGQDFLPEQIIAVYAAEITALGRCIGLEILAYFTDKMYKKLDKKNFVKIFCYLYIFKALNSDLIFGLIN